MNNNQEQEIISRLKTYAAYNVHELTKQNESLSEIDEITKELVENTNNADILSDEEAIKYAVYAAHDGTMGEHFDESTLSRLKKLASVVISICILTDEKDKKTHSDLIKISTRYLYPLYTRDDRTNELGFELQEYTDFFSDLNESDRKQFGTKLLKEWRDAKYID
jgi:hypothetical protein